MGFSALLTVGKQKEWRALRAKHLRAHPYCVMCAQSLRKRVLGNTVDHIKPHRGDERLMLDPSNLQTLCATHHSSSKHREEHAGFSIACGVDGAPLDARHPWNNPSARQQGRGAACAGGVAGKSAPKAEPSSDTCFSQNRKGPAR